MQLLLNVTYDQFNASALTVVLNRLLQYSISIYGTPSPARRRLLSGDTAVQVAAVNVTASALNISISARLLAISQALGYAVLSVSIPQPVGSDASPSSSSQFPIVIVAAACGGGAVAIVVLIIIAMKCYGRKRRTKLEVTYASASGRRVTIDRPQQSPEVSVSHAIGNGSSTIPLGTLDFAEPTKMQGTTIAAQARVIKQAKVLYAYKGIGDEGTVDLVEGDVVEVLNCDPTAVWWSGISQGQQGLFPRDYVRLLEHGRMVCRLALFVSNRLVRGNENRGRIQY